MTNSYEKLLRRLLPQGMAWGGKNFLAVIDAIAEELRLVDDYANQSLLQADPRSATIASGLLVDHETDLGLPDECTSDGLTEQQRQILAYIKLVYYQGMSRAAILRILELFGYAEEDITITTAIAENRFLCGISRCGDRCGIGSDYFFIGIIVDDSASEALTSTLQCVLQKIAKPTVNIILEFLQQYGDLTWDRTDIYFDSTVIKFNMTFLPTP